MVQTLVELFAKLQSVAELLLGVNTTILLAVATPWSSVYALQGCCFCVLIVKGRREVSMDAMNIVRIKHWVQTEYCRKLLCASDWGAEPNEECHCSSECSHRLSESIGWSNSVGLFQEDT